MSNIEAFEKAAAKLREDKKGKQERQISVDEQLMKTFMASSSSGSVRREDIDMMTYMRVSSSGSIYREAPNRNLDPSSMQTLMRVPSSGAIQREVIQPWNDGVQPAGFTPGVQPMPFIPGMTPFMQTTVAADVMRRPLPGVPMPYIAPPQQNPNDLPMFQEQRPDVAPPPSQNYEIQEYDSSSRVGAPLVDQVGATWGDGTPIGSARKESYSRQGSSQDVIDKFNQLTGNNSR